jgi:hypothetical protein
VALTGSGVPLDTLRTGGGAKFFFGAAKADGIGGATAGGVAVLLAVPCRIDEYMPFADDTSTSPNF